MFESFESIVYLTLFLAVPGDPDHLTAVEYKTAYPDREQCMVAGTVEFRFHTRNGGKPTVFSCTEFFEPVPGKKESIDPFDEGEDV